MMLEGQQRTMMGSASPSSLHRELQIAAMTKTRDTHLMSRLSSSTPFSSSAAIVACSPRSAAPNSESPVAKIVIGGGLTLVFEFFIGHPLEFTKIGKQTTNLPYPRVISNIISKKGFVGIWDGFFPWGAVQSLAKGAVFGGAHAFTRKALAPYVQKGYISDGTSQVISGGIGGGFQGFVLSPTLLLKTRVMTDPVFRKDMTMLQTSVKATTVGMRVIKEEGVRALMKGSGMFAFKRVLDWSSRFYFSVWTENILYKRHDKHRKLTVGQQTTASLIGGTFSAVLTIPFDVMVSQIQQTAKAGQKVSVIGLLKEQTGSAGGMKSTLEFVTRGFVPRLAHVALTTALLKTASSAVYDMYQDSQ